MINSKNSPTTPRKHHVNFEGKKIKSKIQMFHCFQIDNGFVIWFFSLEFFR